ncbi:hypothetical protein HDV04_004746, partial [Boothiomyces sp. JEL0838]
MAQPIDIANFDFSVSPRESFYKYVNGSWLIKNQIPGELAMFGSFELLDEKSRVDVKQVLDELLESKNGSIAAEFYACAMNESGIEARGLEPINNDLNAIGNITTEQDYFLLASKFCSEGIAATMFSFNVAPDDRNAAYNTLFLRQGGLGLPDREYYLQDAKADKAEKYKQYMTKLLMCTSASSIQAQTDSNDVFDFEKQLAEIFIPRDELRDPVKNYNKKTLQDLQQLCPAIEWKEFFEISGLQVDELVLQSISYFENLSTVIVKTPLLVLKKYLLIRYLSSAAPYLQQEIVKIDFEYKQVALAGIQEMKPRWKMAYEWMISLRDLIDRLYVERNFSSKAKEAASEMVQYILDAFKARIEEIEWMSNETKQKALLKLSTFKVKIGYPDKYRDFSPLEGKILSSISLWENKKIISKFNKDYRNSFYNKPVDREEWNIPSYMVNAYYEPTKNEIGFPAGILFPPFFYPPTDTKPHGEPALNFGAIGGIIAHEITHGFDDEGSKYDHEGNLSNWWTDKDRANFENKAKSIIEQFNSYTFYGEKVNGQLTAGENIADFGGLSIAYKAFKEYQRKHKVEPSSRFTVDQEFFISWAQAWRGLVRKETALMLLTVDVHSPDSLRAEAALRNFGPFHEAFGVLPGDGMYREPFSI